MAAGIYTLYGTEHSFFTLKALSYLRYKQIPHVFKPATLGVYKRIIIPRTGVRFIPVLITPEDEVIQDTSVIIDMLEARFPQRAIMPTTPCQRLTALLFEVYADEWFLLPGMHYRWSYLHEHEAYLMQEFGRLAGDCLPAFVQRAIGRKICTPFKNSLKPLGIGKQTIVAIEAWFESFLAHFEAHLKQYPFLLGSRPCLGDFALAGPFTAHLARDPYSKQLLERLAPKTLDWIDRINTADQAEGAFLPDDEVPASLNPILEHMFAEQWPILMDTAKRLPDWLQQHPEKSTVSRAIGEHEFRIGDARGTRLLFPNAQWMMQRVLDAYAALAEREKPSVDDWLDGLGGREALAFELPRRLERVNNRLEAA